MTENKDTAVMGHAYKISNMESACYLKTINNRTAIIIIIIINPPEILFFFFSMDMSPMGIRINILHR